MTQSLLLSISAKVRLDILPISILRGLSELVLSVNDAVLVARALELVNAENN